MGLDIYLTTPGKSHTRPGKILIREAGGIRELSYSEFKQRYPDNEPLVTAPYESEEVYWANITHNLNVMAKQAGIYLHIWRPEELGIARAGQLVNPLTSGLLALRANPVHFKKYDAPNKWGTYEQFVKFVESYLQACRDYPLAEVRVSR